MRLKTNAFSLGQTGPGPATSNLTDRCRISIDTHYQLAGEAKNERFFFGPDGTWPGNFYNHGATYTPIAELRKLWGFD